VTAGSRVEYAWAFGDGNTGAGANVSHTYADTGSYTAVVTASNAVNALTGTTIVHVTVPCAPPSDLGLARMPAGDLFAGVPVQFTVEAQGTTPFGYTWTVDGEPVAADASRIEHVFDAVGDHVVSVQVSNACGQDEVSTIVVVGRLDPACPDLSSSQKWASLSAVESGDILTYTLALRNNSSIPAQATLVDPLPTNTVYLPGTAQASNGSAIHYSEGALTWSGQVVSGMPIVIQFAVEVQPAVVGSGLTNQAYLNDGCGQTTILQTSSTYNPGYRLTIGEGALYTRVPTVTLAYSWNSADAITHVKFSNDGGFSASANTTDWLPVNDENPRYEEWQLATYGDLRMPRTVYARFRDETGQQYGPIQDDIIYDPEAPEIVDVEIVSAGREPTLDREGAEVVVRVTARDANSGVMLVQISHEANLASYEEFAAIGSTTDISWTLQESGEVFVRVVDRAGNMSATATALAHTHFSSYLPIVIK